MDNRAVSPVLATLLLVALTVILFSILAAYALSFNHAQPPDFHHSNTTTHEANNTVPPKESGGPSHKEEKWSVEPLPGYECKPTPFGTREYLCTRL